MIVCKCCLQCPENKPDTFIGYSLEITKIILKFIKILCESVVLPFENSNLLQMRTTKVTGYVSATAIRNVNSCY